MSSDDTTWSSISELLFPSEVWEPLGALLMPGMGIASVILTCSVIGYIVLFYIEKTKDIPGAWNPWVIFWLVVCNGIILLLVAWWFGPLSFGSTEIMSTTPHTCVGERGSLEGGLCYKNCKAGYHGLGVRCYADTVDNGAGTVAGLAPCRDGYRTEGLLCSSVRGDGCAWKLFGKCMPGLVGNVYGRLDDGGVCPGPQDFGGDFDSEYKKWKTANDKGEPTVDPSTGKMETLAQANKVGHKTCDDISEVGTGKHTEMVDRMCYKKCPAEYPEHVPGMPYLCFKGGELSYDRGGGQAPPLYRFFGKYTFPW